MQDIPRIDVYDDRFDDTLPGRAGGAGTERRAGSVDRTGTYDDRFDDTLAGRAGSADRSAGAGRAGAERRSSSRRRTENVRRSGTSRRPDSGDIRRTESPAPWLPSDRTTPSEEQRERSARRVVRASQPRSRSVGADAISYPLGIGRVEGFGKRFRSRPRGRGTTARRVQGQGQAEAGVPVRPAVYTQEKVGLRDRVRIARRWGTGMPASVWHVVIAILIVLALAVAAVFGPLRSYYTAWREAGMLQVEYEVVSSINEDLTDDVERLNTLEGIEDEARRRGYVYPDEEAIVVEGLEEQELTEQEQVKAALKEYEEGLPWYVHFLDGLLGYEHR